MKLLSFNVYSLGGNYDNTNDDICILSFNDYSVGSYDNTIDVQDCVFQSLTNIGSLGNYDFLLNIFITKPEMLNNIMVTLIIQTTSWWCIPTLRIWFL